MILECRVQFYFYRFEKFASYFGPTRERGPQPSTRLALPPRERITCDSVPNTVSESMASHNLYGVQREYSDY